MASATAPTSTSCSYAHYPRRWPPKQILYSFRIAIAQLLSSTLPLSLEQAYADVDYAKKREDFTVFVPQLGSRQKWEDVAKNVLDKFKPNTYIKSVVLDKSFLLFRMNSTSMITSVLRQIHTFMHTSPSGLPEFGSDTLGIDPETRKPKRLIVKYSSPNITKSFHVGDLESTIIRPVYGP